MEQTPEERLNRLVAAIAPHPGLADRLPPQVGAIVRQALDHTPVYAIAQNLGISAEAVWAALDDVAAAATGQTPAQPVETGGLGSDTTPGVTGGYGDTAFGSLGLSPPVPTPEEPRDEPV